jgi:uncharacterized protein (DUF697 family)
MHDIDRTQLESDQFEYAFEGSTGAYESPFNEVDEMELASQLLEVTDEGELDQFLGDLIKKAGRAVGKFVKTPLGQALGGILKGAVKNVLPIAGSAIGNLVAPGIGGAIGGKLAAGAGKLFGLELEGMSAEDQEFEVAKQFVRFAGTAAKQAALAPSTSSPQDTAKAAAIQAARQHAPGLLSQGTTNSMSSHSGSRQSGRWIRRGGKIVLFGV